MRGFQLWMVLIVAACIVGAGVAFRIGQGQAPVTTAETAEPSQDAATTVAGLVDGWQAAISADISQTRDARKARTVARKYAASLPSKAKPQAPPIVAATPAADQRIEEFSTWADGLPSKRVNVRAGQPEFDGPNRAVVPVALLIDLPGTTQRERRMPVDLTVAVARGANGWVVEDVDSPRTGLRALSDITYVGGSGYTVVAPGSHVKDARRLHKLATDNLERLGERYENVAGDLRGMAVIVDDEDQVVHVTDQDSVRAETHATAWMYDNGDIVVFWPAFGDLRPEVQDGTFVHELTHMVTLPTLGAAPVMINEGIAMREEIAVPGAEGQDFNLDVLNEAFDDGTVGYLGLIRNTSEAIATDDADRSIISYLAGYATVRYIEDKHGEDDLQRLLVSFRSGLTPDDAIRRVLGMTPNRLRSRVEAWVATETSENAG